MVFNFTHRITEEKKDDHLDQRIIANELSGILNQCIAGWRRVMSRGRFDPPKSCQEAKTLWLGNRNAVSIFVREKLDITGLQDDREPGIDLFSEFQMWCNEENAGKNWGRNNFYSELENLNSVQKYHSGGAVHFHGLRLKNRISDLLI